MLARRWLAILLVVVVFTTSTAWYGGESEVFAAFSGEGDGSTGNPFIITSVGQLEEMRQDLDAAYRLGADLQLNGINWGRIGDWGQPFTGMFDGDGHTISNLTIDTDGAGTNYLGLFGSASNADIRNVGLVDVSIESSGSYIGGLVGYSENSLIENVYVTGRIAGDSSVGGLIGYGRGNFDDAIRSSYSSAIVTGSTELGGLIGRSEGYWTFEKSYYNSDLTGISAGGQPLSEASMKQSASFTGWNFAVEGQWGIIDGLTYPMHRKMFNRITLDELVVTVGADPDNGNQVLLNPTVAGGELLYSGTVPNEVDQVTVYADAEGSVSSIDWGSKTALETINLNEGANKIGITVSSTDAGVPASCTYPCTSSTPYELHYTLQINREDGSSYPHSISTVEQLADIGTGDTGGYQLYDHYVLMNDLDLFAYLSESGGGYHAAKGWIPIGDEANPFTGSFDGNGHIISNLFIDREEEENIGFFGVVSGTIQNIGMTKVEITGKQNAGGIVGTLLDSGTVRKAYTTGIITVTDRRAGGVAGKSQGELRETYSTANVNGLNDSDLIGGLIGEADDAIVTDSYAVGRINSDATTGIGGLIGDSSASTVVIDSFWDIEASGQQTSAGGSGAAGKVSSEMKSKSTYTSTGANWDFASTWAMMAGATYPIFNHEFETVKLTSLSVSEEGVVLTREPAVFEPEQGLYTVTSNRYIESADIDVVLADTDATVSIAGIEAATASVPVAPGVNEILIETSGNNGNAQGRYTLHIQVPAPEINKVEVPDDGNYGIGDTLIFGISYEGPVDAPVGTPRLPIVIGEGADKETVYADFTEQASSERLVFEYQVQEGLLDTDGIEVGAEIDIPVGAALTASGVDLPLIIPATVTNGILIDSRPPNTDSSLSGLTVSTGTLNETFASGTLAYTANVSHNVTSIEVTPFVNYSGATVTVNDIPAISGSSYSISSLHVGPNTIKVSVTAEDKVTSTDYTIIVTRAASSNADLSSLTLSSGTLDPAFAAGTTEYAASVGHSTTSITLTPTVADSDASATVNGEALIAGSAAVTLNVGDNSIQIRVTAADGTTKNYTVEVTRAASSNADLSSLTLSSGTLDPAFAAGTTEYAASVGHSTTSITVTPTVVDSGASATVNGNPLTTGSAAVTLNVGDNSILVRVTAADGTTKNYTVEVTRAASSNADLSSLTLSSGTLDPAFAAGTTEYAASVGHSTTSITVTPTVADSDASATVNGEALIAGSAAVTLNVGDNSVQVRVTAADGTTTKEYTVEVTRASSSNADLSALTLSSGTLDPVFAADTTEYAASVGHSTMSIIVTPTLADSDASATVNGQALIAGSATVSLNVGSNQVAIVVKAADGTTTRTYRIEVSRMAIPPVVIGVPISYLDVNGTKMNPDSIDFSKPSITLEATPTNGAAYLSIPADVLASFASKNADFLFEFKTPYGRYQIPVDLASLIPGFEKLLSRNGLTVKEIAFRITLTDRSEDEEIQAAFAADLPDGSVMGAIVDYQMEIVNLRTGMTIASADQFNEPIARLIPMPASVSEMPVQWGAFRYHEGTETFQFVPAKLVKLDGMQFVVIHSSSNSVYVVAENEVAFKDTVEHWGRRYVEFAAAKGLVEGVGGGIYKPDQFVTRAEFTAMLVRSLDRRPAATENSSPYVDVKAGSWYYGEITAAKELGLLRFAEGDRFLPNQPLTREEMASMIAAAVRLENRGFERMSATLEHFTDIGTANEKYLDDIQFMIQLKIMMGTSSMTFSPLKETTRAQAATVLIKTLRELEFIE